MKDIAIDQLNEDLDIDQLIEALDTIGLPVTDLDKDPWLFSRTEIKCNGCGKRYSGLMQHLPNSPYLNSTIQWCPRCILDQEERWWDHCMRMEGVKEIV